MNRLSALSRAAGPLIAAALAVAPSEAAASGELTIGSTVSPLSLPIEVARSQGFFADEGLTVRLVECVTGPQCVDDLFQRRFEMVLSTDLPLAMRTLERTDFAVVATVTSASGNIRMIGRKSSGAIGLQQLVGKRIGFLPGTSAQYYLDSVLLFYGVDPASVTMVPLPPEALDTAFSTLKIDALSAYSRYIGRAAAELGADGVLLPEPRIYTETFSVALERRTLNERRADVVKFLRAVQRAETHIAAHPAEAKALLAARTKLTPAYVESIFGQYAYRLTLEQSLVSSMEAITRWARRTGIAAGSVKTPNLVDILDPGPLTAAMQK